MIVIIASVCGGALALCVGLIICISFRNSRNQTRVVKVKFGHSVRPLPPNSVHSHAAREKLRSKLEATAQQTNSMGFIAVDRASIVSGRDLAKIRSGRDRDPTGGSASGVTSQPEVRVTGQQLVSPNPLVRGPSQLHIPVHRAASGLDLNDDTWMKKLGKRRQLEASSRSGLSESPGPRRADSRLGSMASSHMGSVTASDVDSVDHWDPDRD
mmetsp:Transcript_43431/g.94323  ORF Transcript_43431/g.94323 Transcript_43431/m.94323 type:complete len:212 (-) Transcript_43431:258-893(-)